MWEWLLILVILHISLSYFFWCYPHLLHHVKKRERGVFRKGNGRCISISHRGGAGESYENTMRAFRSAIQNRTDMLEIDIRCTKDAQLVVVHDENLTRLCGVNISVGATDFNDLPKLLNSIASDTEPGVIFQGDYSSCPEKDRNIPLLSTLLDKLPRYIPLHLDVCGSFCCKVTKILDQCGRRVILGSTEFALCSACQKAPYKFMSMGKVLLLVGCFITGILPYLKIDETHYTIWLPRKMDRMSQSWGLNAWERRILSWIAPLAANAALFIYLRTRGIQVYVWVANSTRDFRECEKLGVDGIMTDYPKKLQNYFSQCK